MRSVGLDLGARHIAFCEVRDGKVVDRTSCQKLEQLRTRIGPGTAPARIAFEAAREAWHVFDLLASWGHEPMIVDTTRLKTIGLGQHKRKNDALDAEAIAIAVDQGRVPKAHVLSPRRRELRNRLSIRTGLVEMRTNLVVTIRGLARAHGLLLPTCSAHNFVQRYEESKVDINIDSLVCPLVEALKTVETQLATVDDELAAFVAGDSLVELCATVPGVGLIVAATFLSVIDNPNRFKNAHAVSAYLGLVPSETTTGGPSNRRLGAITKQGNSYARAMLVQAAWSIMRLRHFAGDPLKTWALRLAKRRGKNIAAIALARRLAGVLWAVCRDGTVYDPAMQAEASAAGVGRRASSDAVHAAAMQRAAKKLRRRTSRRIISEDATM